MSYEKTTNTGGIDLYAASLDDHSSFEPTNHVHWSEHLEWVELADGLPKKE